MWKNLGIMIGKALNPFRQCGKLGENSMVFPHPMAWLIVFPNLMGFSPEFSHRFPQKNRLFSTGCLR